MSKVSDFFFFFSLVVYNSVYLIALIVCIKLKASRTHCIEFIQIDQDS